MAESRSRPLSMHALRADADPREPFERLVDSGLRLNGARSESELHDCLIREAADLGGAQLAGPGPRHEVAQTRRQVRHAAVAAVEECRRDEPVVEGDGDTDVDGVPALHGVTVPGGVERRVFGQGEGDGSEQERRDGQALVPGPPLVRGIDQVEQAVAQQDQAGLAQALGELLSEVRTIGTAVPDDQLRDSDLILPDSDSSLSDVEALLAESAEGLIPG